MGPLPAILLGDTPALQLNADVTAALDQVRACLSNDGTLELATSGTTGRPTTVTLSANALRASAQATAARLGSVGRWVLTLPVDHIAGVQVLVRSELAAAAGIANPLVTAEPPASRGAADLRRLVRKAQAYDDSPVFISLVPTQLRRALADPACTSDLAACRAVLIGGGRCPAELLRQARACGINAVVTYGMTETAGGCVYDGIPLDGVQVKIVASDGTGTGRIAIAGPVLARGCGPWLVTNDLGRIDEAGRLVVLGRMDDVMVTGGVNVHPGPVAALLSEALNGCEVQVVAVPDPEWGEAVTAIVVGTQSPHALAAARARVVSELGSPAAPKSYVFLDAIPLLPSGKPDRRRLRSIAKAQAAGFRASKNG